MISRKVCIRRWAEAQQEFRPSADARWTRPEGIHLTLKFLGEISDAQAKLVVESLGQIGPFEPFSVEVKSSDSSPKRIGRACSGRG